MKDLSRVGEELFNKIRGRFPNVTIGDEEGNVTNDPSEARFFDFEYKDNGKALGKVSISITEDDGMSVIFSKDFIADEDEMTQTAWYNFLRELRFFSKKRMLDFDIRDITKTNLTKRDYKFLANRPGDTQMTESRLYGTARSSYQDIDGARLVIKHTENVDQEQAISRTRNIGRIYIESPEGERFKYPFKHLNGARAMARHVAEGGNAYDQFGQYIVGLSEEMGKLRKFKNYMGRSAVMAESLAEYTDVVNDRIKTVKKTLESLQKKNYYSEAFESFEPPVFEDVPDDVKENWIDQLTIRQFNEDLKDIFPYIYKLVGEATRAKELGPEDLLGEDSEEEVEEGLMDRLGRKLAKAFFWDNTTPDEMKKRVRNYSDKELKALAGHVDENPGKYSERSLQIKLIDRELKRRAKGLSTGQDYDKEIESTFDKMMGQFADNECEDDPNCDCNGAAEDSEEAEQKTPLGEFILSYYDKETGEFPKGETAVLTMIEKDYGEQFIEPAKQFIERVNQTFEQYQNSTNQLQLDDGEDQEYSRMRELAGLR